MSQFSLVVLAAGMGSRYGGLKQLDSVGPGGGTILEYSVFDALRAGCGSVVFVIREEMREAFERDIVSKFHGAVDIRFAYQSASDLPDGIEPPASRIKPWGTAHAVLAARRVIDGPFVVVNADDFYGRGAYLKATEFLRDDADGDGYAMVGYVLRNTLSRFGSVARGICTTDREGNLVSVEELTNIQRAGDGAVNTDPDGRVRQLTGDEATSMNFWILRPVVFEQFQAGLVHFLSDPANLETGEFYIPTAIEWAMQNSGATVKVVPTEARWFGVTYREDRAAVESSLRQLVERGEYPEKLWV